MHISRLASVCKADKLFTCMITSFLQLQISVPLPVGTLTGSIICPSCADVCHVSKVTFNPGLKYNIIMQPNESGSHTVTGMHIQNILPYPLMTDCWVCVYIIWWLSFNFKMH